MPITQPAPVMARCTGIIDLFHGDAANIRKHGFTLTESLALAKANGIVAVLAKATQGKDFVDADFAELAKAAYANGLLFGAYHFASASESGDKQAEWFMSNVARILNAIDPTCALLARCLPVLDHERNPNKGGTVTREISEEFIAEMVAKTNRAPVFYANTSTLHSIPSLTFAQCPIWVAAYGEFGDGPKLRSPYRDWFMWQYLGAESGPGEWPSDEKRYPRTTAGLGQVDRSVFRGSADELRAAWASIGR